MKMESRLIPGVRRSRWGGGKLSMVTGVVVIVILCLIQRTDSKSLGTETGIQDISRLGNNDEPVKISLPIFKSTSPGVPQGDTSNFQEYLNSVIKSEYENFHRKSRSKRSIIAMKICLFFKFLMKEIIFFGKKFG